MTKHLKYLSYVMRHKWFVFVECCKLGIPFRGLVHDLSKFSPSEWFPYANFFYRTENTRDPSKLGVSFADLNKLFAKIISVQHRQEFSSTGYYHKVGIDEAFDLAWLKHQKRNPHHHQFWLLPEDSGGTKVLEMPLEYRKEMLADWRGAGKAQGRPDTLAWYIANRDKMRLGPDTRAWIDHQLNFQCTSPATQAQVVDKCHCCGHDEAKHVADNCGGCMECNCAAANHYDGGRCDPKTGERIR